MAAGVEDSSDEGPAEKVRLRENHCEGLPPKRKCRHCLWLSLHVRRCSDVTHSSLHPPDSLARRRPLPLSDWRVRHRQGDDGATTAASADPAPAAAVGWLSRLVSGLDKYLQEDLWPEALNDCLSEPLELVLVCQGCYRAPPQKGYKIAKPAKLVKDHKKWLGPMLKCSLQLCARGRTAGLGGLLDTVLDNHGLSVIPESVSEDCRPVSAAHRVCYA